MITGWRRHRKPEASKMKMAKQGSLAEPTTEVTIRNDHDDCAGFFVIFEMVTNKRLIWK